MKWIGINNLGCTWEPKEHFVGADAEEILKEYIHSKEAESEKTEKRREDILAGKLVVTGKHAEEPEPAVEPLSTFPAQKTEAAFCRTRQNALGIWGHFNGGHGNKEKFYWDNSIHDACFKAINMELLQHACFRCKQD